MCIILNSGTNIYIPKDNNERLEFCTCYKNDKTAMALITLILNIIDENENEEKV